MTSSYLSKPWSDTKGQKTPSSCPWLWDLGISAILSPNP
jgi:hypothetical protein